MTKVIAICTADIHLSQNPPVARSVEPDWFLAMERPLKQLGDLAEEHNCPIIAAGDIFDRYSSSPELINWAIKHLPPMYAVSGQHDQPYHNLDDLHKSAYWTLVEAGIVEDLSNKCEQVDSLLGMMGFPWGSEIESRDELGIIVDGRYTISIAVIHSYVYSHKANSYPGAPIENQLGAYKEKLKGYDVAIFGDNHKGFLAKAGDCNVINCGSLIRRSIDEKDYKPFVGLIYDDGHIEQHFLDVSEDKWMEVEELPESKLDDKGLSDFVNELKGLDRTSLDFRDAVLRYMESNEVEETTKEILLEVLGE